MKEAVVQPSLHSPSLGHERTGVGLVAIFFKMFFSEPIVAVVPIVVVGPKNGLMWVELISTNLTPQMHQG